MATHAHGTRCNCSSQAGAGNMQTRDTSSGRRQLVVGKKMTCLISLHYNKSCSLCILLCNLLCLHSFGELQMCKSDVEQDRMLTVQRTLSKFRLTQMQSSHMSYSRRSANKEKHVWTDGDDLRMRVAFLHVSFAELVRTSVPKDRCVMATSSTRMLNSFALFVRLSRICMLSTTLFTSKHSTAATVMHAQLDTEVTQAFYACRLTALETLSR